MKVLVATQSAFGYAACAAEIARRLTAEHHDVRVVTGRSARALFPSDQVVPAGSTDADTFVTHEWAHPLASALQFKHVEFALRDFDADLVVTSELTWGVRLAAHCHDLPLVTVGSLTWLYPLQTAVSDHRDPTVSNDRLSQLRDYQLLESQRLFAETATALGTTPPGGALPFLGDRYLMRSVPALHGDLLEQDGTVRLAGSVMPAPVTPSVPRSRSVLVMMARTFGAFDPWDRMVAGLLEDPAVTVDVVAGRGATEATQLQGGDRVRVLADLSADECAGYDSVVLAGTTWQTLAALRGGAAIAFCPAGAEQPVIAEDLALRGRAVVVHDRPVRSADLAEAAARRQRSRSAEQARELQQPLSLEHVVGGW